MYTDLPRITRCCFCIPLRYGLLAWAYIKLMFCLFVAFVIVMRNVITQSRSVYTTESIVEALVGIAFLIEISITIVFIVGAHTKKPKLLTVYYRYTIVIVTLTLILYVMGICADVYGWITSGVTSVVHIHEFIEIAIVVVGSFLLNLYQMILIKNEIVKLENNSKLSFVNDGTDPKCVIQCVEREPDNV